MSLPLKREIERQHIQVGQCFCTLSSFKWLQTTWFQLSTNLLKKGFYSIQVEAFFNFFKLNICNETTNSGKAFENILGMAIPPGEFYFI